MMFDREQAVEVAADAIYDAMGSPRAGGESVTRFIARAAVDAILALSPLVDGLPSMATGEAFSAVYNAILDPEHYCQQLTSFPKPLRQMEAVARWQTRAVLAALSGLTTPPVVDDAMVSRLVHAFRAHGRPVGDGLARLALEAALTPPKEESA